MNAVPDRFDAFRAAYESGRGALVWRHDSADLLTPVAAFLKAAHGKPFSFLLESIEGGVVRGRYSVIGMEPDLIWRCEDGAAFINRDAATDPAAFVPAGVAPIASLRALVEETRLDVPDTLPPMTGGLSGYLGYDMVRLMEKLPATKPDVLGIPEAILVRSGLFIIFDNVTDEMTIAAPVYPRAGISAEQAYANAQRRLNEVVTALERPVPKLTGTMQGKLEQSSNMEEQEFWGVVETAKNYIRAGDVFQVVPSQRFEAPFPLPPFALYRSLRHINPAPFLFYLDFDGFVAVGSSPEILVRLRDGKVTIRPLAGTRRRGADKKEDAALEADLLADPKERAEHLMLLDLGRNDVGRVAEIGSVRVAESFAIERFSHVMHISSTVEGTLRADYDALDALIAGFPAGTLSGAPKVRAMEIIEELEPSRRGLYAGCIGYFAANGTMDTCIGLRTALVKDGTMYVQAGVGVVADSDPQAEYAESVQKARALFRAAEDAARYVSPEPT
ncbi:MAG TPA: anthranilate synthase component I [Acidocella sp.]|uniref:anthranilate synthase component I n=1 Tax=Acidocella sp. TaxID=50710 RepID=UPI002B6A13AA|nr:anthranilate synthase component I [Acidocella sp.]HVE22558.1 anthranilate synthase component I [Acidocella sp.]